ncbi:MAG TPA: hypothetical protein VGR69_02710 [Candidatus Rubrimentiphilum sp.]|nr:hypothetical protein [Candidatus Rubrimentiphilum sp.]
MKAMRVGFVVALCAATAAPAGALGNFNSAIVSGVTIVRQYDSAADLIGTQIRLQAGLDRQLPEQNGLAALVAESILQTPVAGAPTLRNAIEANGGSIQYDVDPRAVRFYVEGLPDSYAAILGMVRTAMSRPDFSAATLTRARAALDQRIAQNQEFALAVGLDMLNRTFYPDSDAGLPPLGLPQTLATFETADAQKFYASYYLRGGAIVSTAGNLQPAASDLVAHLLDLLPPGSSVAPKVNLPQLPSSSRQLIARRDIPVPWLIAQYRAPNLNSADFGAMLVLTAFLQRTLADVAGVPALSATSLARRGVGAIYNFDTQPANVVVYVDGAGGDPTRAFATALTVVNVLGHAHLQGSIADMKTFAIGQFLNQSATLRDRAWLAGVFAGECSDPDYISRTIAAIEKTSAKDLQRVATRYLGVPNVALVLPRGTPENPSP